MKIFFMNLYVFIQNIVLLVTIVMIGFSIFERGIGDALYYIWPLLVLNLFLGLLRIPLRKIGFDVDNVGEYEQKREMALRIEEANRDNEKENKIKSKYPNADCTNCRHREWRKAEYGDRTGMLIELCTMGNNYKKLYPNGRGFCTNYE